MNLNTCHVWAEDGEMVESIKQRQLRAATTVHPPARRRRSASTPTSSIKQMRG